MVGRKTDAGGQACNAAVWRVVAGASLLLLAVGTSTVPASAATSNVSVADNNFEPVQITVTTGDTVLWTDNGNNPHTVTADDNSFDSANGSTSNTLTRGQTFSHAFAQPGTYAYYCRIHGAPGGIGMHGTIVVQAAAATTTAPATPATTAGGSVTATTAPPSSANRTTATTAAGSVSDATTATTAAAGTGTLAKTGVPIFPVLAFGVLLVMAGLVIVRAQGSV
jgi:plastocyanin